MSEKSLIYRLAEVINNKIAIASPSNNKHIPQAINLESQNTNTNNSLLTDRTWNDLDIGFLRDNMANFDLLLQVIDSNLYDQMIKPEQKPNVTDHMIAKEERSKQEEDSKAQVKKISKVSQKLASLSIMFVNLLLDSKKLSNISSDQELDLDQVLDEVLNQVLEPNKETSLKGKEGVTESVTRKVAKNFLKDVVNVIKNENIQNQERLQEKLGEILTNSQLSEEVGKSLMEKSVEVLTQKNQELLAQKNIEKPVIEQKDLEQISEEVGKNLMTQSVDPAAEPEKKMTQSVDLAAEPIVNQKEENKQDSFELSPEDQERVKECTAEDQERVKECTAALKDTKIEDHENSKGNNQYHSPNSRGQEQQNISSQHTK